MNQNNLVYIFIHLVNQRKDINKIRINKDRFSG